MDKILEKFNLPKLTLEELRNVNSPKSTFLKCYSVIKNFSKMEDPGSDSFTSKFFKHLRKD